MIREQQRNKRWREQAERAREDAEQRPPAPHAIHIRPAGSPTSLEGIFGTPAKKRG
jgi:hypothetical protein